jgi:hypothetical protein
MKRLKMVSKPPVHAESSVAPEVKLTIIIQFVTAYQRKIA